jgi:parvulin-like peptidyl-prolyl isomerase
MEYTHRGMLPEAVQLVLDKLQPKQLSEPVQLLEGVTILRLDDRKAAQQRAFEQVKERAAGLWQREEAEQRWKSLLAELRKATPVRIDETHYAPLRGPSERPRSG